MRLTETSVCVPLCEPKDYGSLGVDFDSPKLVYMSGLAALITFGAITGNSVLTVYNGATKGAKTTAIAFKYRFGGGDFKAASADTLGAPTAVTSAGLTLTAATFDHRMIAIEV